MSERATGWQRGAGLALATLLTLLVGCIGPALPATMPLVVAASPWAQGETLPAGRLVFVVGGDIWQWEDGDVRQLTTGSRYEGPSWAPDGALLAATVVGGNHSDV